MVADDYREVGAKILDPIANNIPLGPMSISFLSLLTAIGSGYSFYTVESDLSNKEFLLFGSGLVFLTAVLDALDGIVARKRGLSSKRGDLVDYWFLNGHTYITLHSINIITIIYSYYTTKHNTNITI